MKINVLVTGVGGYLGQSIAKALKMSKYDCRIIGCDMNPRSAGLFLYDKGYIMPPARDKDYIPTLLEICAKEKVKPLFPGNAQELLPLATNRENFLNEAGTVVMTLDVNLIKLGLDKYKTVIFLKENGLAYPQSIVSDDKEAVTNLLDKVGFPLIIKPKFQSGSRNVYKVNDNEELGFYSKRIPDFIIQEYLFPDEEEYTCGVFSDGSTQTFTISLRRELDCGVTVKSEVVHDQEIHDLCKTVAKLVKLKGAMNIQLRKTLNGPIIFEMNPRYSSTTCIKAHYGFKDAEWAIDTFLFDRKIYYNPPSRGLVMRFWDEVYVDEE